MLPERAVDHAYSVKIETSGENPTETVLNAVSRTHSKRGTRDVILVSDLKPASQYKFKVSHVNEDDEAVGKLSSATGYILSSEASPAEKLKMKLQRLEQDVSDAIHEYKEQEERLRVTSHVPLPTTTVEETLEECIARFDATGARQDALVDQRDVRAAVGKFGKKLQEAVTELNAVVSMHHKTSGEQTCWLPQDLEQALKDYAAVVENLEREVKVPSTNATVNNKKLKEEQLKEFKDLGVKLANAIEASVNDIKHQVDSNQAKEMYNKIIAIKALVPEQEKGLAAAVQKLETGLYSITTWVRAVQPSLNRQESVRI